MSAANPKFKVGDVLVMTNDSVNEDFTVVGTQTVDGVLQYVLHNLRHDGGVPLNDFALDVDFVDANPIWVLKSSVDEQKPINWLLIGLGGAAAAALVVAVVMMAKRNRV